MSAGLARLRLDAGGSVTRKVVGCRTEFEDSIPISCGSGEGRWGGAESSEVQIPCSPPAPPSFPCRLTWPVESSMWHQAGAGQAHPHGGLTQRDVNLGTIWITGESLPSLGLSFLSSSFACIFIAPSEAFQSSCWLKIATPWEVTTWWESWTKSSDVTRELSWQLGHAVPQQNSDSWGLLRFIALLFWCVQLCMLSADPEKFLCQS